ncbi:MAG: type IV pilus modification PilV family protein [Myxococcota bacterium]
MTPAGRRRGGFTLIEVMVAVAVMTVGALGVMALQQAATRGNMEARMMSTATQVARTWLERLRRDALLWNQPGAPAATRYLSAAPAPVPGAASNWLTPPARTEPGGELHSFAFDYFGNDTNDPENMVYCAHVRYVWLVPEDALRAEVRAFWHRRDANQRFDGCAAGNEGAVTAALAGGTDLRAVHAAAVIRRMPLAQ